MAVQKIIKYKLPAKLKKETKKFIEESYFSAVDEMGDDEFDYICRKIDNKLKITREAATAWICELSSFYSALFEAYNIDQKISSEAFNLIGAALFYFINPFDIIPDYTPGIGYLDDLFVLTLCLKSLNRKDKKIVNQYFEKVIKNET